MREREDVQRVRYSVREREDVQRVRDSVGERKGGGTESKR